MFHQQLYMLLCCVTNSLLSHHLGLAIRNAQHPFIHYEIYRGTDRYFEESFVRNSFNSEKVSIANGYFPTLKCMEGRYTERFSSRDIILKFLFLCLFFVVGFFVFVLLVFFIYKFQFQKSLFRTVQIMTFRNNFRAWNRDRSGY